MVTDIDGTSHITKARGAIAAGPKISLISLSWWRGPRRKLVARRSFPVVGVGLRLQTSSTL
ncbi:hypothetical protein [Microbispora sp. NPDC049633]|uniref:hypothetical protein n=1 Tax=Microbispora sp. NPDC049633 TaxID=3154355 RepID=UPI00343AE1AE